MKNSIRARLCAIAIVSLLCGIPDAVLSQRINPEGRGGRREQPRPSTPQPRREAPRGLPAPRPDRHFLHPEVPRQRFPRPLERHYFGWERHGPYHMHRWHFFGPPRFELFIPRVGITVYSPLRDFIVVDDGVLVTADADCYADMIVVDEAGRRVASVLGIHLFAGERSLLGFPYMDELPVGTYYIHVDAGGAQWRSKIVLQ